MRTLYHFLKVLARAGHGSAVSLLKIITRNLGLKPRHKLDGFIFAWFMYDLKVE